MTRFSDQILVESNICLCMRERGKLVPNSLREGHNVFTNTGRNLLSKLISWSAIGAADEAFTQRRVRWIGVGDGSQLETTNVSQLNQALIATGSDYLVPVQDPATFPDSTSVQFAYEFATDEITVGGAPVIISEVGMFADINPAATAGGTEDSEVGSGITTTLNPAVATNPPVAYKAFEGFTKTVDFTLEVRWTFRF